MSNITKERIELFIKNPLDNGLTRGEQMELARIALASLEAEPVAVNDDMAYAFHHALSDSSLGADEVEEIKAGLRAAFANVTIQPVPVVPDEIEPDDSNTFDYVDGWNACRATMLHGAKPVSQTYNLPELIEGMEVSIDVSTCDADLGNRYFGTVTEALELDTAKNGYILLVQDAEPNFDVNGNSPVTPDGWISCSDRMPEDTKMLLAFSQGKIVAAYWNWVVNPIDYKKYRAFTYLSGYILDDVTHWMPLPEPPL
ncbi:hypothetical protein ECA727_16750 [Escherichia coli ECA-727]|nr:hypothetical protein ECA727_16750 [Escherichia coli ECA-727]